MDDLRPGSDTLGVAGAAAIRRLYCVGMAGTGMKAIAEWFAAAGWQVSGSDRSATPKSIAQFQTRGMRLFPEHSAEHLPPQTDLLIYSPAVPETNPERLAAQELGIPQWSYPQALGQLMHGHRGISIAGTHGKSTTTALVGHVLRQAGLTPSILCGAEMIDTGLNGVLGGVGEIAAESLASAGAQLERRLSGSFALPNERVQRLQPSQPVLVAESCEYRGHFLELSPRVVGLLGIEPDHFDCFPTFDRAIATYREFISRIPADGLLVTNRDCETACSVASDSPARTVFVSTTDDQADYFAERVESTKAGLHMAVRLPNRTTVSMTCPLWGQHHAINILTALAIATEHGVTPAEFTAAAQTFAGIRRRFERRGDWNGVTWVDDYAHHPTALRALIDAARDRFPGRHIWCVFQPHQISRTRELSDGFVKALCRADGVLIQPVFGAREATGTERIDLSRQLVEGVRRENPNAHFVADLDHTWTTLETHTRPGDVVLTVGAGDIDHIYHELTGRLRRNHAS
ncbi:MAG: Mur ligase family protein [Planctomycetaceae bacterium]